MGCNSEYMQATTLERDISRVVCLLGELEGKQWSKNDWDGYHKDVYCHTTDRKSADHLVKKLCSALQETDVTKYSLEMQMWWRDHQAADKARLDKESEVKRLQDIREVAMEKLTPEEKKAFGFK